ncbi:MAG: hypothetical protein AAF092_05055 [Pseudomonadota bacterium]
MLISCVACAPTDAERLEAAGQALGEVRAASLWPDYPEDCRRTARGDVQTGDRLDVAVLKLDDALTRQNARTRRCAAWYDQQRGKTAQ